MRKIFLKAVVVTVFIFVFFITTPFVSAFFAHFIVNSPSANLSVAPLKSVETELSVSLDSSYNQYFDSEEAKALYRVERYHSCEQYDEWGEECIDGVDLCPYLAVQPKNEEPSEVGFSLNAIDSYSRAKGEINGVQDATDKWNVSVTSPCFEGECPADYDNFVNGVPLPQSSKGKTFTCDLEVNDNGPIFQSRGIIGTKIAYAQTSPNVMTISAVLTGEYTQPATGYSNVLFIPGLEASRLYKPDYNGGTEKIWEPSGDEELTESLFMDKNGVAIREDIYTRDVVDSAYILTKGNVYKSFLEQLSNMKNTDKIITDYSVVPYDWRLSLEDVLNKGAEYSNGRLYYAGPNGATSTPYIIQELRRLAANSGTGKVTIVAHSNGGLITKALTNKLGAEASHLIDKIIFVAVPQTGTPKAIGAILHGFEQSLPINALSHFGINDLTARELAQNMPSAYNLIPSAQYFTYVDDPVIIFKDDPLLAGWRQKYGTEIHSTDRLRNFLVDQTRTLLPTTESLKSPASGNSELFSKSELVHNSIDNWIPPEGIALTEIAGWGEETLGTIIYYQGRKTSCSGDIYTCRDVPALEYNIKTFIDGDGTVVVPSALWTATSTGVNKYWVNLQKYDSLFNLKRKHADIFEIPQLRTFIQDIISNKPLSDLSSYEYITAESPEYTESGYRLHFALHSPLSFDLYDEYGNHTGFSTTTDSLEENIPNSRYLTFGELKYISVPKSSGLRLFMRGNATGSFTLDLEEVSGESVIATTTFSGVPTIEGTLVKMEIPGGGGIEGASDLQVDIDADGDTDLSLIPKINEVVILDANSPETEIKVDGVMGLNDWYTGNLTINMTSTDSMSGVLKTSYSIDGGLMWNDYKAPFIISTEGTTTIQYFSTDNWGNKEDVGELTVRIDKTPPQARIFIDSASKDLKVEGVDNLSSASVLKDSNDYIITDNAGHTTKLLFQKTFTGKRLTYARLTGVKYDGASTKAVPSSFLYIWNILVNPPVLLSQTIVVDKTYVIEALYDKKKNQTTVFLKKKGEMVEKQVFPGFHVITLTVNNGVVGYEL